MAEALEQTKIAYWQALSKLSFTDKPVYYFMDANARARVIKTLDQPHAPKVTTKVNNQPLVLPSL